MDLAVAINIKDELAAARGECPFCRIVARHPDRSACPSAIECNAWLDRDQIEGPDVQSAKQQGWWSNLEDLESHLDDLQFEIECRHQNHSRKERTQILGDMYILRNQVARLKASCDCCDYYDRLGWIYNTNQWLHCPQCGSSTTGGA